MALLLLAALADREWWAGFWWGTVAGATSTIVVLGVIVAGALYLLAEVHSCCAEAESR